MLAVDMLLDVLDAVEGIFETSVILLWVTLLERASKDAL
jgi:hypothetical protein